MKKFLALVMAASMAFSLVACGGASASSAASTAEGASTEATAEAGSPATYTLAEGDMGSIITVTVSATDKDTYTLVYNVVAAE